MLRICIVLFAVACAACGDYPRDPQRTGERVQGGTLRAGVSHDPPFVMVEGAAPRGREVELVRDFARAQHARVVWIRGGHDDLMRQLQSFQIDLVVGGYDADSPWAMHVATSRPYRVLDAQGRIVERVAALPPGENAWALAFDRYAGSAAARRILQGGLLRGEPPR